jgi:hypothetical protein
MESAAPVKVFAAGECRRMKAPLKDGEGFLNAIAPRFGLNPATFFLHHALQLQSPGPISRCRRCSRGSCVQLTLPPVWIP